MVFSSLVFLFVFFPIVVLTYYFSKDKYRNYILLISSLFFYAWGEPTYIILMITSIIFNYLFGLLVSNKHCSKIRKFWLIISVVFNLSILGIFKYLGFFISNLNNILNLNIPVVNLALPLGISFFTFQAVSYVIDVYRDEVDAQNNIFYLALYISLFPQLVAGPIVRYQTVCSEIQHRQHSLDKVYLGINRFVIGLSKKVLLSNPLGMLSDDVFGTSISVLTSSNAWLGIIAYSLQIFFDFSGYSDMAIGLGYIFGFEFLENFNYPYISQSASEFWRRWHISLGSWFKDYVYIPLGGSRKGTQRTYINLFIVWFLTGFWHGASWTFIAWGLYFGLLIGLEKAFLENLLSKLPKVFRHIYLIIVVMIGWIFFRSDTFSYAFNYITTMFNFSEFNIFDKLTLMYLNDYWYIIFISILFSMPIIPKLKKMLANSTKFDSENTIVYMLKSVTIMTLFVSIIVVLVNSTYNPFLYFRF